MPFGKAKLILALGMLGCLGAESLAQEQGKSASTPSVFIEVQADGEHCIIRKATISCTEVLSHLRQVLNLAPGYWVRFKADRSASHEVIRRIMDEIAHSEYRTSASFL